MSTTMIAHNNDLAASREPTENDTIEALTGRRHISWSQMSSYRGCPRRWAFSHVEAVEPSHVSSALILGSSFHDSMQYFFEKQLIGESVLIDELCDTFRQSWDDQVGDIPVRFSKGEDEQSAKDTGARMLQAFHGSEHASLPGTLIGVEETLSGEIHPDLPTLTARIDLAYITDDALHVLDFKTSRSRWSDAKVQESADQLVLYSRLASRLAPDLPVKLEYLIATKAKKPAVQKLEVPAETASRTDDVIEQLLPIYRGMVSGIDYPNPGPMCSGCGYKHRCPAFNRS